MYVIFRSESLLEKFARVFMYYPGFNYVKLWSDIVSIAGEHYDISIARNVPGRPMVFEDIYAERIGTLPDGSSYHIGSIYSGFQQLFFNTILFFSLAVYFDKVLGSNSGIGGNWFWCLKKDTYWPSDVPNDRKLSDEDSKSDSFSEKNDDGIFDNLEIAHLEKSVQEERKQTMKKFYSNVGFKGLQVCGIGKTYKKHNMCGFVKQKIPALKNIY